MIFNDYFTESKIQSLKVEISKYFPTTNTTLFDMVYKRMTLLQLRLTNFELRYENSLILDAMYISAVVNVLDKKWLYLVKLQSLINLSLDSFDDLSLKTDFTSTIDATLTSTGTNNDSGTSNGKYGTGYKGFDSINTDSTFSVDKDDRSYANNRTINSTNKENRGLTTQKSKQDLEQYIALFNSTMDELNKSLFSELISLCRIFY